MNRVGYQLRTDANDPAIRGSTRLNPATGNTPADVSAGLFLMPLIHSIRTKHSRSFLVMGPTSSSWAGITGQGRADTTQTRSPSGVNIQNATTRLP